LRFRKSGLHVPVVTNAGPNVMHGHERVHGTAWVLVCVVLSDAASSNMVHSTRACAPEGKGTSFWPLGLNPPTPNPAHLHAHKIADVIQSTARRSTCGGTTRSLPAPNAAHVSFCSPFVHHVSAFRPFCRMSPLERTTPGIACESPGMCVNTE
jgi:hypothetical protein